MPRTAQLLKNLQQFRLITFDVTDTLLRFRHPPAIQYAKTAALFGITDIDQQCLERCFRQEFKRMATAHPNFGCYTTDMKWQQWWLQLVENIFYCVRPNIPAEQMHLLAEKLLHLYRTSEAWVHMDSDKEILHRMQKAGKLVGVISNFDPSLRQVLSAMELEHYFDFVLTSYDAGVQKPHNRIFELALECAQALEPDEALHIGNTYALDYVGARNTGWCSLLVGQTVPNIGIAHETHAYKNLTDLLHTLETKDIVWK